MHSPKNLVSLKKLYKAFGNQVVIQSADFTIHAGEKIGIVGPNGSGKTTILKMIMNELSADEGIIDIIKGTKISYFAQTHEDVGLSGGETAKKILVPILKSDADLFLLDEPTNNLDSDGLEMLENFIMQSEKAFLIISHDRRFLDKTVTKIIEIDEQTKETISYEGNYSEYREQRTQRIERQWKEYADKIQKTKNYKASVEEKLDWKRNLEQSRKNVRNLPIHEKEKPVAAILRDKEGRMGRRARIIRDRMTKHIEETEDTEKPRQFIPLRIQFEEASRGGTRVFDVENVTKKYGQKKIGPISLHVQQGEKILIQGRNGTGKSTLIKMLTGELKPDEGTIEQGTGVRIGYIAQDRWNNTPEANVLEVFMIATELEEEEARSLLSRFRITSVDVKKSVSELSPGEYSRVLIASLVAQKPNCIILDEPTNHLDLEVAEELEKALERYNGSLIIVSHDRYFIDNVRFTRTVDLNNVSLY